MSRSYAGPLLKSLKSMIKYRVFVLSTSCTKQVRLIVPGGDRADDDTPSTLANADVVSREVTRTACERRSLCHAFLQMQRCTCGEATRGVRAQVLNITDFPDLNILQIALLLHFHFKLCNNWLTYATVIIFYFVI